MAAIRYLLAIVVIAAVLPPVRSQESVLPPVRSQESEYDVIRLVCDVSRSLLYVFCEDVYIKEFPPVCAGLGFAINFGCSIDFPTPPPASLVAL